MRVCLLRYRYTSERKVMKEIININKDWIFEKEGVCACIDLPHTWNAKDGQDGGDDYYRGVCCYRKKFDRPVLEDKGQVYLEFNGVNSTAEVWLNGIKLAVHDGGYSRFRVNITKVLRDKNVLEVKVDNRANDRVYPQKADFTFYGGIYRDVNMILVPEVHFDLDYYGTPGIKVTPCVEGKNASVTIQAYVSGKSDAVRLSIEGVDSVTVPCKDGCVEAVICIEDVHLWNGISDPYLYHASAELLSGSEITDRVDTDFGCRTYRFDPEEGFFLNGRHCPLHGVSKHQDRRGVGNAITREMLEEDMELIVEMGANSIRLAHYQHDQYFYDLCDRRGVIVWAEIPYITRHMPDGRENTVSQMRELIIQNYNHPSVVCWALSNEVSVAGVTEDLLENHRILNDLAHRLDATRVTAMADAFMLEPENPINDIPDILSYNLYYGWYMGELEDNDRFFDDFHKRFPKKCIGLSEYGADAHFRLQSAKPQRGDYSEQYQCVYHEHMLKMFTSRPYIWGSYVWNMFDFGADGREEAGDNGVNHKGLVSFDRKIRKDAFYLYKAYWSSEPFIHLCGKRYVDRAENMTEIKVYTNQERAALYCDGKLLDEKEGAHIFAFIISISGEHTIEVRSHGLSDRMHIRKADSPNPDYYLETTSVRNWFDEPGMEVVPGYFSIQDTLEEIRNNEEGRKLIDDLIEYARAAKGGVTKAVKRTPQMQQMLYRSTVIGLIQMAGGAITQEMVRELNRKLTQIPKKKSE